MLVSSESDLNSDMNRPRLWFERRFDFSLPAELLPNLLVRLRGAPARIEEMFRGITRETLVAKPQQKWSAQEHAGHLLDLEALWLARLEDYAAGRMQLTPADLTNRGTDEAHHNSRELMTILAEFRTARSTFVARAAAISRMSLQPIPHPRLHTPMRPIDHLFFVAEHDDHHLARIWELTTETSD